VQNLPPALSSLQQAVTLNPHVARYWLDLAAAYASANNLTAEAYALEHALNSEPTAPDVAWEAGTFYLAQNNLSRALPLFKVVVENDDQDRATKALYLCWRTTRNVPRLVSDVLPSQSGPYFSLLKILISDKQRAAANQLWDALVAHKLKFQVGDAFPYFDYLISTQEVDQAKTVWRFLTGIDGDLQEDSGTNVVVNAGFERAYLNGGFGWRKDPDFPVDISLDTSEFHSGTRALRFLFSGPAFSDTGIYQYVPVQPRTAYRLTAFVKSEDIVSASGPRLGIQDVYGKQLLVTTDDLLGTSGWRQQTAEFVTGPDTRLVTIRVLRIPGNPLIKGKFWLDDVNLVTISKGDM
jgi:tetratricopeptide (TPR) repeat protein